MSPPRIAKWMSFDDVDRLGEVRDIGGWGGMMTKEMRWADFIADINPRLVPYYQALREAIVARGLRRGGDWHQSAPDGVPVFDDGAVGTFSYRAWGDLMAAVWSGEDGRGYGYMDFYMDCCVEDAGMELSR
jgi:hypothetical protein